MTIFANQTVLFVTFRSCKRVTKFEFALHFVPRLLLRACEFSYAKTLLFALVCEVERYVTYTN